MFSTDTCCWFHRQSISIILPFHFLRLKVTGFVGSNKNIRWIKTSVCLCSSGSGGLSAGHNTFSAETTWTKKTQGWRKILWKTILFSTKVYTLFDTLVFRQRHSKMFTHLHKKFTYNLRVDDTISNNHWTTLWTGYPRRQTDVLYFGFYATKKISWTLGWQPDHLLPQTPFSDINKQTQTINSKLTIYKWMYANRNTLVTGCGTGQWWKQPVFSVATE